MSRNDSGDISPRREEQIEEEMLSPEDGDETSNISESLFKGIINEEDIEEVVSGMQDDIPIVKEGDLHGTVPRADIDTGSSGEEASVFEDIGDEDFTAEESGYIGTPNRGTGLFSGLCPGGSCIADEVPLIRTSRKELDDIGSLPAGFASSHVEDDGCVKFIPQAEEMESRMGEETKEESSLLAGIARDCGTCVEEGGEDVGVVSMAQETGGDKKVEVGTFSCLTDDKEDDEQNLILPQNSPNRLHESLCSENIFTAPSETNSISVEDKTSGTGPMTENDESYETLGEEKTPLANAPKPQVRRRGRPNRELGALLMDSNAGRRGMRDSELQGPYVLASAQLSEREGADSIGASDRTAMLSSDRMSEVRVTRSQALGRSGTKDGHVDSKVETITPPETSAKRTGKRSVTRGGRPGWGNANESCPHNLETVANVEEKNLSECMGEDVHSGAQLAKSEVKGKSRGKGKKAPTMVGAECVRGEAEPEGKTYSSTGPVSSGPENVEGSEPVLNPSEETNASSRQESVQEGPLLTPQSEEKKSLDVDIVSEDKKVGKRRSNRQTTKTAKKAEEGETACDKSKKSSKGRKRSSENGGNKTEEVLDVDHVNPQPNGAGNVSEISPLPENVTIQNSGTDTATHKISPRRSTGRKPAKEKLKADAVNVVKQKKGLAVSRRCSVGKGKSGGRSRVKQCVTELAVARSVNQETEHEMAMERAEEDGGCSRGVVSTENDSVGADQGSDKNASSITGDIKDVCQDQKKLQGSPRISTEVCDFETSDRPRSKLDSKDDLVRPGNSETCNSSAYVIPAEQFSEENHRNLVGSSWTVNLVSVTGHEKDANIEGTGGTLEEGDSGPKSPTSHGNDKNTEGDTSRDTRDDIGYATSCDSLVKREGDVVKMGEGVVPIVGLGGVGERGDLILTTQTEEVALSPGTGVSGQTKARQRKGTRHQLGAKLVTQSSRKGKKGSVKNVSLSSDEISVPLEEALSSRSNKKKVGPRKDRKKSALEISGKHGMHLQGVSIPKSGKASDAAEAVNTPVQEEGLHEADKQSGREAEDKLAYSGSEIETTERQKLGSSGDGGPPSQSLPAELVSDKCETSAEACRVDGAKRSRKLKGKQKKPTKSAVPAAEAVPSGAKRKNDTRRPTRAKGATIKALLRVKEKSKQVASGVKGGASDVHASGRLRNDVDAAHSLEVVQNSVNVECVEGSRVREGIDSPDNAATGEDMSSGVTQGERSEDVERPAEVGVSEDDIPRKSWVLCDDCNKWRCIPVELADEIDNTNAKWSCRDNPNPDFADCSIPQEKSNAEINAELQISEVSGSEEEDDNDGIESKLMDIGTRSGENKPAVWKMIRRNIFQHRRAKTQASDEVMICQCTPPEDGGVGCGDNCLNRVLNIECVQEYCPCGEACSNQQFQKRMYAPVATFRCGKKGFGLKVLKSISKDSFLIEYVGEVLDVSAFEKRQEEYARIGQKHFYFMTLNSTEVIDACSKGNLGRFINHSCEPNCKTEKWMVNGEVCIGLFAIRDIAEGEEVTFDYNYVRVRGASAKKCKCGSSQCRGFIGTDSETPRDEIVESDSDEEEDPEPVMVVISDEEENRVLEDKVTPPKKQRDDKVYQEPTRPSRIKRKLVPLKEEGRAVKRMKTNGSSRIKKVSSSNPKGLTVDTGAGRHESGRALSSDVQDKLDDLLDDTGGLKKKKDVPRQYLRLLLLSTASGDNEKESSGCSVRDVSLLLEALLRTWSRSVLSDIMKNNGLRVLHTFIKQLRWQWDKTPILRKLMKVLEHLSSDRVGVLTQNMINSAAPSRRVESFSESLFELTRHRDPEVCVMARRFRYKWIPPRPPVYERLPERPPQPPPKSVSPMKVSNQTQPDDNHFQSPRKQSPNIAGLEGTEVSKPVKGPSYVSGTVTDGTAPRLSQGQTPASSGCDPQIVTAQNVKRKRVSRWDAPAKVPKGTYEPVVGGSSTDVQGVNSTSSSRQTYGSVVPPVHSAAGGQSQSPVSREQSSKKQRQLGPNCQNGSATSPLRSEAFVTCTSGKQGAEEVSGVPSNVPGKLLPHKGWQPDFPGQPASWQPATSLVNQDPERLPFGVTSGQPLIHSGAPVFIQGRPEPVYGFPTQPHLPQVQVPFPVPPAIPPTGPPPHYPTGVMAQHLAPHQVSAANGVIPGGVGFPTNVYPGCPPLHVCLAGPPLQSVNGMAPNIPLAYPQGVHYGHWVSGVGMSHFAGPPAFPLDESRMCLPQPLWQNTSSRGHEPGGGIDQRIGAGMVVHPKGDLPSNCVRTAASVEAEPPVPGLSPPLSTTPNTQDSAGVTHPCTGDSSQERKIPAECRDSRWRDENWGVQETSQDRGHGPHHHRAGVPDLRETGNGFLEEQHWDDPESQSFRDNVFSLVRSRVQRHKLKARDVDKFCSKLADVIVRKEVARCVETRNRGCEKKIVRSKLVQKLESYVDREVENFSRRYDRNHKSGDR